MPPARNSLSGEDFGRAPPRGALTGDAEGAISARKRSGPRTADGGSPEGAAGLLESGRHPVMDGADPPKGSGADRDRRLISQVTGQKGGRFPPWTAGCTCRAPSTT